MNTYPFLDPWSSPTDNHVRCLQPPEQPQLRAVVEALAIIDARWQIKKHRKRAAHLGGPEQRDAVAEANTIAAQAGLLGEGELAAA